MREASRRPMISRDVEVFWQRKIPSFHAGWEGARDDDASLLVAEDAYSLGKGQRVSKMSFRFRKRLRLAKLLRVNLAQSGASLSVRRRGATVNLCSNASILCSSSSIPRAHLCTGRHHRKARTATITARTGSARSLMKLRKF